MAGKTSDTGELRHLAEAKLIENKEVCELLLQGDSTAAHWVDIEAIADNPQREVCRLAMLEIIERKQAEIAL